jgi:D-galactarate dehydratase / Altronate hydrolase, C terminus
MDERLTPAGHGTENRLDQRISPAHGRAVGTWCTGVALGARRVREAGAKVAALCRQAGVPAEHVALRFCLGHLSAATTLAAMSTGEQPGEKRAGARGEHSGRTSGGHRVRREACVEFSYGRRADRRIRMNKSPSVLRLHRRDNVAAALRELQSGEPIESENNMAIRVLQSVPVAQKVALQAIAAEVRREDRLPHARHWPGRMGPHPQRGVLLFTTGRGSVISPVVKVCGNPKTFARMSGYMDINASRVITGEAGVDEVGRAAFELLERIAGGRPSMAERLGHREYFVPYKSQDFCIHP